MARFVQFPGVAGSYVDTKDVNLLDADTSHIVQSVGKWAASTGTDTPTLSSVLTPLFGATHGAVVIDSTSATAARIVADEATQVVVGQTYTWSMDVAAASGNVDPADSRINLVWFDSGGSSLGTSPGSYVAIGTTFARHSTTNVAPASAVTVGAQVQFRNPGRTVGDIFYFDAAAVRVGTDQTFRPSVRIVSDVDIEADTQPTLWVPAEAKKVLSSLDALADNGIAMTLFTDGGLLAQFGGLGPNYFSAPLPYATGSRHTTKITRTASDGEILFYADGVLHDTVVGTSGPLNTVLADPLTVGRGPSSTSEFFDGGIFSATLRDGIGGPVVAEFDAEDIGL